MWMHRTKSAHYIEFLRMVSSMFKLTVGWQFYFYFRPGFNQTLIYDTNTMGIRMPFIDQYGSRCAAKK